MMFNPQLQSWACTPLLEPESVGGVGNYLAPAISAPWVRGGKVGRGVQGLSANLTDIPAFYQ